MTTSEISVPLPKSTPSRVHGPHLSGIWRISGIVVWASIWIFSLSAFFVATYKWYRWDSTPIAVFAAQHPQPPVEPKTISFMVEYQAAIRQLGMSLPFYGGMFAGLRLLACIPYFILSALIMRRRNDRLMAVLFAMVLAVMGAAGRWTIPNWIPLASAYPQTKIPLMFLSFIMDCSLILLYTFPDGRFVPRWTRWLALYALLFNFINIFLPQFPLNPARLPGLTSTSQIALLVLIGLLALFYRYRRLADAEQKQQIKWLVASVFLLGIFYFAQYVIYLTPLFSVLQPTPRDALIIELALEPTWYVAQAVFAACLGISIFRYRLWDIDLVINRVLVYGSLTVLTMGIYIGTVVGLGTLVRDKTAPLIFFLATGLIAILFEPLRRRLQRLVNRLMYGERDEPYRVLTRLINSLEHSAAPGEVLPTIAETVSRALKIPYVAILIYENGADRLVASIGNSTGEVVEFPLVYQQQNIGILKVGKRARNENFSTADQRLLENIAQQAGSVVETVRLHAELVRSRAEIVIAREEERRRLRRDLHDGLGPILASQTLKLGAVRQLVRQNPERAEMMVDDVIQQNENTVSEVRRLVYGLRPPALDELGLVEAVRELVRLEEAPTQSIAVVEPEQGLPKLPAAVEVNAYRIALEGLTNARRHAQAQHTTIQFTCQEQRYNEKVGSALVVQISDDGSGMPKKYQAGVGIRSMRERAEELGGQLSITPVSPHGTQINAWLPLEEWK